MFDQIHEECGVFGIYNNDGRSIAHETYLALYALQHRGQNSCGIAINDSGVMKVHKDLGLVPDVFDEKSLAELGSGDIAIGHVRYSPSNETERANNQPLVMRYVKGTIAIACNGTLVNTHEIRKELEQGGAIFQTSSDLELVAYLIARARLKSGSIEAALKEAMAKIEGAYSLVLMSPRKLIACRDPHGFRPLCMGKLGESYVFASETCAFDSIGAEFVRDVEPGEIILVDENGMKSLRGMECTKSSLCIFEHVYVARPDSVIDGASVHMARQKAGAFLAKRTPVDADIVIGVPDSGLDAALGYANESGIPYGTGFIKNRYVGRTFIQDSQIRRERSVKIKLNPLAAAVKGKRVVMIDDSIVRGTTSAHIVELLRKAGATEVHVRISSPPFMHPCYFGTDIDSRDKLIACRMSIDEICKSIGADSLAYLELEDLMQIAPESTCNFCNGCFTGIYPVDIPGEVPVDKFNQKIVKNK